MQPPTKGGEGRGGEGPAPADCAEIREGGRAGIVCGWRRGEEEAVFPYFLFSGVPKKGREKRGGEKKKTAKSCVCHCKKKERRRRRGAEKMCKSIANKIRERGRERVRMEQKVSGRNPPPPLLIFMAAVPSLSVCVPFLFLQHQNELRLFRGRGGGEGMGSRVRREKGLLPPSSLQDCRG